VSPTNPLALLALLALAACGGNRPQDSVPEPREIATCNGNAFVSVINDWNRAVDIYASTNGSLGSTPLGTVPPGSTMEFVLPRDATGAVAATPGLTDPVPVTSAARPYVRLRYLCR